jgi:hypothetical protein
VDLDFIISRTEAVPAEQRRNAAKEALQESLLAALAIQGALQNVAFQGGTALRILHGLPRYSEDLDFIWTADTPPAALPSEWTKIISGHLRKIGVIPHMDDKTKTVSARIPKRVSTIYLVAAEPKLKALCRGDPQISFEIDLNPPAGFEVERKLAPIANNPVIVPALNLPSLMAGKLHILLTRLDREKGRDWYDYAWYRKRDIEPNLKQLQNAVDQTNEGVQARFWMSIIRARLVATDWTSIRRDVEQFLERKNDAANLTEFTLSDLTPYPEFKALLPEVTQPGSTREIWGLAQKAVREDIAAASLSGDMAAIELEEACERAWGPRPTGPDKVPGTG